MNLRVIKNYFESLYSNKMENLGETDKFLDIYDLPKLNTEDIKTLNRPVTRNQVYALIKTLLTNKNQGPIEFIMEF